MDAIFPMSRLDERSTCKGVTSMGIRETIKFSRQAYRLKLGASKPAKHIQRLGRKRLEQLVGHARTHSEFWRDKLSGVRENSFALSDLPTCNKSELMEHFDESV